ncbi:hypothetical protein J3S85_31095 [Streptomyces lavenduligriseus]|nr:hypothetical protein J3S85_31095 [Streptomyces lavenduligriseus]
MASLVMQRMARSGSVQVKALRTFARTEIDYLYLDGLLVPKSGRTLHAQHPHRRPLNNP